MFEDVKQLLNAGFTKDEIMEMMNRDKPAPKPEPDPKPEPEPKPEPDPKPEEKDPEPFNVQPFTDGLKSMEEAMNALNAKMQKLALSIYEGREAPKKSTADILLKIVDPKEK